MDQTTPTRPCLFRFGVFEADPRSGELRRNGARVRLQEQPFQVLLVLLERAGDVIAREELQRRLWSHDTFVDFDHGLNTAINKLRDALGDTAGNPRFLQTLPRRGYRFIAPVQRVELAVGTGPAPIADNHLPAGSATDVISDTGAEPPAATIAADASATSPTDNQQPRTSDWTDDLPRPHRGVTRLLFALLQVMHLCFYVVALTRLDDIHVLVDEWRGGFGAAVMAIVLVSATVGIALKLYLLSAVAFDYRQLGPKFRLLFPLVLPLDQLWALSPFLLLPHIGPGVAFAACAALLYVPFSERTLVRMAYR